MDIAYTVTFKNLTAEQMDNLMHVVGEDMGTMVLDRVEIAVV